MDKRKMISRRSTRARARCGSTIAEFGPSLWILLVFIFFPLIDLISFCCGVSTVMLMASMGSRDAAPALTFSGAQIQVKITEANLANFMQFARISPIKNTGVSCEVIICPASGGQGRIYQNPLSVPTPVDAGLYLYQYVVTASYNVSPLFNFAGSPVLGNVPALGAPVPVTFSATVTVEHPEGLKQ